jgi:hypothetical protein
MAREVNTVLAQIIAEQRGVPESKAEEIVKSMRSANQYQVRVSIFPQLRDKACRRLAALYVAPNTITDAPAVHRACPCPIMPCIQPLHQINAESRSLTI